MAKKAKLSRSTIKWTDKQQKALSKSVQKFNAKLTREQRANPSITQFLPDRLNAKALRKTITTAKDLDALIRRVDRAFKPGAFDIVTNEAGTSTTRYEYGELKLGARRINRMRTKERERLVALTGVQPSPETGTLGSVATENLKPNKKGPERVSPSDWEKYVESVEKQVWESYYEQRDEQYKENYLAAIARKLGGAGQELYSYVAALPPSVVAAGWLTDPFLDIDFVYSEEQASVVATAVLAHWKAFNANIQG